MSIVPLWETLLSRFLLSKRSKSQTRGESHKAMVRMIDIRLMRFNMKIKMRWKGHTQTRSPVKWLPLGRDMRLIRLSSSRSFRPSSNLTLITVLEKKPLTSLKEKASEIKSLKTSPMRKHLTSQKARANEAKNLWVSQFTSPMKLKKVKAR